MARPKVKKERRKVESTGSEVRAIKLAELIDSERLDSKKIIKCGIKKIPDGSVAYDETFRRDLDISTDKWKDAARDPEFDKNKASLPNRKVVWGKAKTIDDLKKQDGVK